MTAFKNIVGLFLGPRSRKIQLNLASTNVNISNNSLTFKGTENCRILNHCELFIFRLEHTHLSHNV